MPIQLKRQGVDFPLPALDAAYPRGAFSCGLRDAVDHNAIITDMETYDTLGRVRDSRTPERLLHIYTGGDPFIGWSLDDPDNYEPPIGVPPQPKLL